MNIRLRRWLDFYYNRYVGLIERYENYFRTRNMQPRYLTMDMVTQRKRSDTIFLLGSGPSINKMSEEDWAVVRQHESLAINWFIVHPFVPTLFITEVSKNPLFRQYYMEAMERRREDYSKTVIFVHHTARKRGLYPRFLPGMFPEHPTVCFFELPPPTYVPKDRPFEAADFKKSFIYRGTMNVAVYLAYTLGFKNIVLLGMDLKTNECFYDNYEGMRNVMEIRGGFMPLEERKRHPYGMDHIPKHGRFKHGIVDLYYALNDFVLKPEGIRLYVGTKDSLLYPRIPLYAWPCRVAAV